MKYPGIFLKGLFSIYGLLVFIAVMFLLLPFVIIASFFGKVRGGNMIYNICRLWADLVLFFWGIRHRNLYEARANTPGATVFVFNHISYLDIPLLLKALPRLPLRVLGKAELSKVPVFGYIYGKAVVAVDRSCEVARAASVAELKKVLAKDISIVLFPEGTFNETPQPLANFYSGAFRIAVDTDTIIQPVLFLDTYRLMNYRRLLSLRPGNSRAVFLPASQPGDDPEKLKEQIHAQMTEALIRYKADWIGNA